MGKLSMNKISEILRQKFELKRCYRDIATSLNISVGTVTNYIARAKTAGITWPLPIGSTEQELYKLCVLPVNIKTRNRPTPDWNYIQQELCKKGLTLQLLWREYRMQYPEGLGYAQFCNHYKAYKKTINPVMRQHHKAGEKSFVDYAGMTMEWVDLNGEVFTAEIFVGCLGASQLIFVEATPSQQLEDWINSHINMFEFFTGVTEIVVPDNLKAGITKSHRYDPDINANYQHFAAHYGTAIVPARARAPKDKAKVENAVGIVERQILAPMRNMIFTSISAINSEIKIRLKILNNQQFQKMNASRWQLFEQIDKPALKPLPSERYQYALWKKAKINIDYHFVIDGHYYSVPHQYIGKQVTIRCTQKVIECMHMGERIATHERNHKQHNFTTIKEHMPTSHQEQAKFSADMLKQWASKIGSNTVNFITHMMSSRAIEQQAYRACLGVLRLSNKYGILRLEKACAKALLVGATRYQQIENILRNNLEEVPIENNLNNTKPLDHENIRGAKYYH